MSYREQGKSALRTMLKHEQNIRIVEKHIYEISVKKHSQDQEVMEQIYKHNIYQALGDILNKKNMREMIGNINSGKLGWNHLAFKQMQNMLDEQNDFIENPFAVEEGVLECKARD